VALVLGWGKAVGCVVLVLLLSRRYDVEGSEKRLVTKGQRCG
jgi:hypothetical protein